jgi:nucleoside-diphosphate-sugar epimerase
VDPYGQSKLEAEQQLLELSSKTGMEVVIVRPVLVYGPGVKGNMQSLMRWIARGRPIPLGETHNRRSLVGLGNLVSLIERSLTHPGATRSVLLVSDREQLSTSELIRRLAAAMGMTPRTLPVHPALVRWATRAIGRGNVGERLTGSLEVDIAATTRLLDWTPSESVDEGLRKMTAAFAAG